jgi:CheY-like chemotaxis protein/HPt (histidine-containing phosphotransfer) domain-containing protein
LITERTLDENREAQTSLNVLLAEDNEVNQRVAMRILEKRGHRVVVAGNGLQALNALRDMEYDLVLMDVQMPEMDGLEATVALRSLESGTERHQPVIAMTALVMQGDRERCLAAGMDGYLTKPIRPRALEDVLDQYVALKRRSATAAAEAPKPATRPDAPPERLPVDGNELLERVGDDHEFLNELVALFREDGPKQLGRIRSAIEKKESAEVLRSAHSMRGTFANLGADPAAEMAAEIEQAGKSGELAKAEATLQRLELEFFRVMSALDRLCEEVTP